MVFSPVGATYLTCVKPISIAKKNRQAKLGLQDKAKYKIQFFWIIFDNFQKSKVTIIKISVNMLNFVRLFY